MTPPKIVPRALVSFGIMITRIAGISWNGADSGSAVPGPALGFSLTGRMISWRSIRFRDGDRAHPHESAPRERRSRASPADGGATSGRPGRALRPLLAAAPRPHAPDPGRHGRSRRGSAGDVPPGLEP